MERVLFFLAEDVAADVPRRHESMNRPGPEEEEEERAFIRIRILITAPPPPKKKSPWGSFVQIFFFLPALDQLSFNPGQAGTLCAQSVSIPPIQHSASSTPGAGSSSPSYV